MLCPETNPVWRHTSAQQARPASIAAEHGLLHSESISRQLSPTTSATLRLDGWAGLGRTAQWNRIRKAIYKRDKNTCVGCGRKCDDTPEGRRICHHIYGWDLNGDVPDLRLYATLCSRCHGRVSMNWRWNGSNKGVVSFDRKAHISIKEISRMTGAQVKAAAPCLIMADGEVIARLEKP